MEQEEANELIHNLVRGKPNSCSCGSVAKFLYGLRRTEEGGNGQGGRRDGGVSVVVVEEVHMQTCLEVIDTPYCVSAVAR